jgi:peptidoglycan/xylan/chitin deacetylase (PgdA/CDA1 family)
MDSRFLNGRKDAGRPSLVAGSPHGCRCPELDPPQAALGKDAFRLLKKIGFALLFVQLLYCQKDFNSTLEPPVRKILTKSGTVKPNSAVQLWIDDRDIPKENRSYAWSTNLGHIEGTQDTVTYYAPDASGSALIRVSVDQGGTRDVYTTDLLIASQVVILKADDWTCDSSGSVSGRWVAFVNFVREKKIKASLGIIGRSLEKGNRTYLQLIRELNKSGSFEFWNHGYDHVLFAVNPDGEKYCEFFNTSLADQTLHLQLTQRLAKERTGVVLNTFGAPGNFFDENTAAALRKADDIKVWFFGSVQSDKMVLVRRSEIEFPAHNPDFDKFIQTYDSTQAYQVFQTHPDSWDKGRFEEFRKIIDFLISKNVAFLTSREYFRLTQTQ